MPLRATSRSGASRSRRRVSCHPNEVCRGWRRSWHRTLAGRPTPYDIRRRGLVAQRVCIDSEGGPPIGADNCLERYLGGVLGRGAALCEVRDEVGLGRNRQARMRVKHQPQHRRPGARCADDEGCGCRSPDSRRHPATTIPEWTKGRRYRRPPVGRSACRALTSSSGTRSTAEPSRLRGRSMPPNRLWSSSQPRGSLGGASSTWGAAPARTRLWWHSTAVGSWAWTSLRGRSSKPLPKPGPWASRFGFRLRTPSDWTALMRCSTLLSTAVRSKRSLTTTCARCTHRVWPMSFGPAGSSTSRASAIATRAIGDRDASAKPRSGRPLPGAGWSKTCKSVCAGGGWTLQGVAGSDSAGLGATTRNGWLVALHIPARIAPSVVVRACLSHL